MPPSGGSNLLANKHGVRSQQSYLRVAKRRRGWRDATTMPGSSTATVESCASFGDIGRKIEGHQDIEAAFALPLARASQIRSQQQRQRGWKPFHAPASASARARPVRPTSSASRSPSSPPTPVPRAAGSCCMPWRPPGKPHMQCVTGGAGRACAWRMRDARIAPVWRACHLNL
jgi:hypothetical protein